MRRRGSGDTLDRWIALVTGVLALTGLAVLAAVTTAAPETGLLRPEPSTTAWWLGAATLLLQAVALLWRRTAPRVVLLAAALGMLLCALWGLGDAMSLAQPAVLVAAFTLGLAHPLARSWPAFVLAALLIGAAGTTTALGGDEPVASAVGLGLLQGIGTVALPLLVAVVVAARREVRAAREIRAAALEREHALLVQAAVARERTAMARELHDIAAHHLSGIAVMTAAIGTQIDSDPAGARTAVAQVRQQSTTVLRDLRSLVGLLREGDTRATDPDRVRPESLAGVAALVDDVAAAGRDVGLTVLAGPRPLGDGVGPLAQLAAYRMVQEALANAARHAPGARTEVTLDDRAPEAVLVTVRNARPDAAPPDEGRHGFGLVGMQERADLTGGTLEHGATADGGWQVTLRVPRDPTLEHPTTTEDR